MLLMFVASAAWIVLLALIQYDPTLVANTLMDTADLDAGAFWLLRTKDNNIAIPAIGLLVLFAAG